MNVVEMVVFVVLFLVVTVLGFLAARWRARERARPPRRVGAGRPQLRRLDHLVPGRRRPLHRVHLRRGAGADVRRRRDRLLRGAVHRSCSTRSSSWSLLRLWSVSHRHGYVTPADFVRGRYGSPDPGAAGRDHRDRRDHAVHRAAAGRHRGGAARAMGVTGHLPLISRSSSWPPTPTSPAAGAGADRVRQGRPDLHRDHRRGHLPAGQARRLGRDLRRGRREVRRHARRRPTASC